MKILLLLLHFATRRLLFLLILIIVVLLLSSSSSLVHSQPQLHQNNLDGPASLELGKQLFEQGKYDDAAPALWKAILLHGENADAYNANDVFNIFMQCYTRQGKTADGLAFVALESYRRGQIDLGKNYLHQALSVDPNNELAQRVQHEFGLDDNGNDSGTDEASSTTDTPSSSQENRRNADLVGKSPEQLYAIASEHFSSKQYEECADIFELSCQRSDQKLGPSCANAIYCRSMIADYGFNGSQFDHDMDRITNLITSETKLWRHGNMTHFSWQRAQSVHPHMTLSYPICDVMLKRYVAESVAFLDEKMARASMASTQDDNNKNSMKIPPLPDDMPFAVSAYRDRFQSEAAASAAGDSQIIRVGFVGSGFNSKAVLYLSQDMFRFFDSKQFEIHVFSFGPPDHPYFIQNGMRGVDWRERVISNVDFFHDCQAMKMDHIKAARFIHDQNIHILIEWDGYARQGERAQGLFALRPAPIQILHQEYLGTSGAQYVDYLFSDETVTRSDKVDLYTEKIIWLPNHFFSKGHAYQAEVKKPTYDYAPKRTPYEFGTGSPQENRCLQSSNAGPSRVSFVFCNFNKLLKANPETIRSWIRILREVPNSMLCLLENPEMAMPYIRRFVHEAAGTSNGNHDMASFIPGDGDDLNSRIHFLPWEKNPFDHQMRNQDFCNVMLDSHPYNGHTVAQDALYGGVPIITRSDGDDMSSRVTTSANVVLGLEELNAYEGPRRYEDIAIRIGNDADLFQRIRRKLIDSCLQRNPMHPYWDVARYVKNFEAGLKMAWANFLDGKVPEHIRVQESSEAVKGTYDDEILSHPPMGIKGKHKPGVQSDEL